MYNEVKFEIDLYGDRVNNIYNNKDQYKYHEEGLGYCAQGDDDLPFQAIQAGFNFWAFPPNSNRRQFEKEDGEPSLTTNIEKMMEAMKESHEEVQGAIALTVNDPLINERNAFDIDHRRALQAMAEFCTHTFLFEHVHFMKPTPQKDDQCCLTQSTRPSGDKLLVCFVSNKSSYRNFNKSKCKISKMNPPGKDQHSLSTELSHHGYEDEKVHQKCFVRIDVDKSILGNADEHTNIYNYLNLFYGSKQVPEEAESVQSEFATYQRSQFHPRWSPLKDWARWDIEVPPDEATALAEKIWYEQAQQVSRTILAFPSILYEDANTFMAFPSKLVKNAYTKGIPFGELTNMLDLESNTGTILHVAPRSANSLFVRVSYENPIDPESLTLEENFATTQKRGLIFVRTVDGKYCLKVAPTLDASFDELANVHPPEVPNTVLMIAPPGTSFREANYAAALFGSFSDVKHYQSGPRIHYESVYDNRESAIIANNSIVDSFSFKYYDADPHIRANIIATHSKGKQKSDNTLFTIGTVFGASKQLEKFQKDPLLEMRYD